MNLIYSIELTNLLKKKPGFLTRGGNLLVLCLTIILFTAATFVPSQETYHAMALFSPGDIIHENKQQHNFVPLRLKLTSKNWMKVKTGQKILNSDEETVGFIVAVKDTSLRKNAFYIDVSARLEIVSSSKKKTLPTRDFAVVVVQNDMSLFQRIFTHLFNRH